MQKTQVICHILYVSLDDDDEKASELKDQLSKLNFDVGEVCQNLSYSDTLEAIYQRIFPHRNLSEVKLNNLMRHLWVDKLKKII